ncbi:MAG: CoA-binding protein [Proteobacteria bacterium]|nr:CoA-binding protein [Pseudomonadota bacterium]NIS67540.1 CoA-binding protein [Pseudomonadota bacterium]
MSSRTLDFFFEPRSIAVIGASPNALKGGNALIKNLQRGYSGSIYPVNPKYVEIEGLPCFPKIAHIGAPVDLAIVFVSAHLVPEALRDCAAGGVKGVMIQSGGFAETGKKGRDLQETCRQISAENGMRLWGPNCMGLVDGRRNLVFSFLNPAMWEKGLTPGDVSLIVQSGMLSAGFLIDLMSHGTMGVSKVCSIGNKVDVDECELLEYLVSDMDTAAVALYLEGISKGRAFLDVARRSTRPIVVLKGGKSPRGAQAAMSHTASLSGDDRVVRGALIQAGIVEAKDFKQMMDLSRALAMASEGMRPGGVAVLTFSGGAGILSADFLTNHGMDVAILSGETCRRLEAFFPPWMPVANPIDLWPAAELVGGAEAYRRAVEVVMDDDNVNVLLLHAFAGGFRLDLGLEALASVSKHKGKPIFFWLLGMHDEAMAFQRRAQSLGMPVYRELSRAVEALHAVCCHGTRGPEMAVQNPPEPVPVEIRSALQEVLGSTPPVDGPLDEFESKKILSSVNIPTVQEAIVADSTQALSTAQRFGFPVVLKGLAQGKIHRTELGLIKLDLFNRKQILLAFEELIDRLEGAGRVLIQKQIKPDVELICGMIRDRQFGPAVMFGVGGVFAELYEDIAFRIAPLSRRDALHMMDSIRAKPLLAGFREKMPIDRDKLAQVLTALGWIGLEAPRVTEIDINPVAVVNGKPVALDATVVLRQPNE